MKRLGYGLAWLVWLLIPLSGCKKDSAAPIPCPPTQILCDEECVDPATERKHCGFCGNFCPGGEYCQNGECAVCMDECMEGERLCTSLTDYKECGDPDRDTCREWTIATACPGSQRCADGKCFTPCTDECARDGQRECLQDQSFYRVCGYWVQEDCLSWGTPQACSGGQICVGGSCVAACTNDCATPAATLCQAAPANGYLTCADHNADSCLEWGGAIDCKEGDTCQDGACVPLSECKDDCTVTQRLCQDGGYRVCGTYDEDDCLDWSPVTNCTAWEACNPDNGQCEVTCGDECESGRKQCAGSDIQLCANTDPDPCLEWGIIDSCGVGTKCVNGSCVPDCIDTCNPQGTKICDGAGYRVCGYPQGSPCLAFGEVIACPEGETCSGNGSCSTTCSDDCAAGEKECSGAGWRQCGSNDADSCLDWLPVEACEAWEICSAGACVINCSDACYPSGTRKCSDSRDGTYECQNTDADPCLEWGTLQACAANYICDLATAKCVLNCQNTCQTVGARQCSGAITYDTCGDWDSNGCLEWGNGLSCTDPLVCSLGDCVSSCADECTPAGSRICEGEIGYRLCGEIDGDSCLDLSSVTPCASNERCQDGNCVAVCSDACTVGGSRCLGQEAQSCADWNADGCLEWGTTATCGANQLCYRAQCVASTPPVPLVVSKALYDIYGTSDKTYSYIEIFGPAGSSLNNFTIAGINGNGKVEYLHIDLDGYTLPDNGHFVIAPSVTLWDHGLVDLFDDKVDPENGPDELRILWAGQVRVDAVAYPGTGDGDLTGLGEGEPAPSAKYDTDNDIVYCLARIYDNNQRSYLDTNDNYIDFLAKTYCAPGGIGYGERVGEYSIFSPTDSTPALDLANSRFVIPSEWYIDLVGGDFNMRDFLEMDGQKSSPALSPDLNTVYLGIGEGLRAYDISTNAFALLWVGAPGYVVRSSPAVAADGAIYFGTRGGGFYGLLPNGTQKWLPYPAAVGIIDSSPAVGAIGAGGAELVVFGVNNTGSGKVVALNTATGSAAWVKDLPAPCDSSPALGSDGTVYIACDDGKLYAYQGSDGALRAGFPVLVSTDGTGAAMPVWGRSPTVVNTAGLDWIYGTATGSSKNFYVIGADGSVILRTSMWQPLSSVTLTQNGGFVLVVGDPSAPGTFVVAFVKRGPKWILEWYDYLGAYDPTAWIGPSPNAVSVNDEGWVFVTSLEGLVFAYTWAAGLDTAAAAYPKFRGDIQNSGRRF